LDYIDFLKIKKSKIRTNGFESSCLPEKLFDFQSDLVKWATKKGKSALWAGTGLGKTFMQISWAHQVVKHTGGNVIILAPLAVSSQTIEEAKKIDIEVSKYGSGHIQIANYEQLHNINHCQFVGVVLDESSILKNFAGKFRNKIIDSFHATQYKLCCSATPSPNDYTEIGNHAEFLNICSRSEMLATYFVHDSGATQKWRLKGHAESEFFRWLSTWAVMINKPSDIGYKNDGFDLPPINYYQHTVKSKVEDGFLFHKMASTLSERREARKESIEERCRLAADLSTGFSESWLYWCDLNHESESLARYVENAVEVKGTDKNEVKESRLIGFSNGDHQKLITKPKIAQFGMNWQHCRNMVFVGLSDSFEAFYQAVRRCWRFGQKQPVNVHVVISEKEGNVVDNIRMKEQQAAIMQQKMVEHMACLSKAEINDTGKNTIKYESKKSMEVPGWLLTNKTANAG